VTDPAKNVATNSATSILATSNLAINPTGMGRTGRAAWHRPAGLIPLAYLLGIVAVALAHSALPYQIWLLVHLLLLGAATNAIVVWGAHFAGAILRPRVQGRHGAAVRLAVLNAGVLAVLAGGTVGPAWLGVAGAAVVFAAIAAHLWVLATWLRRSLPARFAITVRFYLSAGVALLLGIPAGAWMLVVDDDQRPRLLLFHAHVNLLGWITLTVLGTLLTLWPTVLRTRMVDGASSAATRALPLCQAGLACLGIGTLAWWPALASAGLVLFGAAVVVVALPAVATARQRPPASFATWSIAAAMGWLVVALGWDAVALLTAPDAATAADRFGTVVVPLGVGFVAQVLIGSLSFLLPTALGGGPGPVRERLTRLDAHWAQRVTMANLALAVYVLPVPPYVRITTSMLVLAALVQFLVPAVRIVLTRTKAPHAEFIHIGQ
jgi:nitrite reductase (NO-forming)